MLRIGHIGYSNIMPVHAGILSPRRELLFELIEGIPTELNRMLREGKVDLSPSSSIEYAKNPGKYLILPGFSITSKQEAKSIILQSRVPMDQLGGKKVFLTTASATSVILLRILLEEYASVVPRYLSFEQGKEHPYREADAVLTIGDQALKMEPAAGFEQEYDLGEVWRRYTGLPFVFALWQINYQKSIDKELTQFYHILNESKAAGLSNLRELSERYSPRFGIAPEKLQAYWNGFSYDLGPEEERGLMEYYRLAARIGAVDPINAIRFWREA